MKFKKFRELLRKEKDYAITDDYDDRDDINSHNTKVKIIHLI